MLLSNSNKYIDYVGARLLLTIPIFIVIYLSVNQRDFQLDDALIYLRYIKNFHEGHGLVYNPGDSFNGLTSPLFTYAVLLSSFVITNPLLATITISCLFMVFASIVAGQIFSENKWEAAFTSIAIGSFGYFYSTFGLETPLFLMFFLSASAYGAFVTRKNGVAIVALVFLSILGLFYVGLNIPNYHWYYAPFFFLMIMFVCKGIWYFSSMRLSERSIASRAVAICVIVAAVFSFSKVVSLKGGGRHEAYAQIGNWLRQNTSQDASVAMVEIGTVGWYADRKIIDILGLVNKYNADYIGKGDLYSWLNHYRPDYILRHEPRWALEKSTKALEEAQAYMPANGFDVPGYVLLKKSDSYSDQQISEIARRRARCEDYSVKC